MLNLTNTKTVWILERKAMVSKHSWIKKQIELSIPHWDKHVNITITALKSRNIEIWCVSQTMDSIPKMLNSSSL